MPRGSRPSTPAAPGSCRQPRATSSARSRRSLRATSASSTAASALTTSCAPSRPPCGAGSSPTGTAGAELRAARWRPEIDLDGLDALIERQIVVLDDQQAQLKGQVWEIAGARRRLRLALPEQVRLVRNAAPRFHRPNDPVLVLAGDGISPRRRTQGPDRCGCADPAGAPYPAWRRRAVPHPEAAQLAWAGALGEPAPGGRARDRAARVAAPLAPVELAWRVALELPDELDATPARTPPRARELYARRAALDFTPTTTTSLMPDAYEGRTPLAANATAALEIQLARAHRGALLRSSGKPIVAQSLGGFTHALDDARPDAAAPGRRPRRLAPGGAVRPARRRGGRRRGALRPACGDNPFTPLRCGRFTPSALRLVDEFGRWRDVDLASCGVSETIPRRGRALLPPLRLSQAAQLRFRWRIAGRYAGEASVAPAGSPICGWVVPNRLDGGIVLYAGDGKPIARFVPGADDDEPEWFGPPSADDAAGLADALAPHNAVLAGFGLSLLNDRSRYLRALTGRSTRRGPTSRLRSWARTASSACSSARRSRWSRRNSICHCSGCRHRHEPGRVARGHRRHRESARPVRPRRDARAIRRPARQPGPSRRRADRVLRAGAGGEPDFGTFFADADGEHDAIHPAAPDTLTLTSDPPPRRSSSRC